MPVRSYAMIFSDVFILIFMPYDCEAGGLAHPHKHHYCQVKVLCGEIVAEGNYDVFQQAFINAIANAKSKFDNNWNKGRSFDKNKCRILEKSDLCTE